MLNVTLNLTAQDLLDDAVFKRVQQLLGIQPLEQVVDKIIESRVQEDSQEIEQVKEEEILVSKPPVLVQETTKQGHAVKEFETKFIMLHQLASPTFKVLEELVDGPASMVEVKARIMKKYGKDPNVYAAKKQLLSQDAIEEWSVSLTDTTNATAYYKITDKGRILDNTLRAPNDHTLGVLTRLRESLVDCVNNHQWVVKTTASAKYNTMVEYFTKNKGRLELTDLGKQVANEYLAKETENNKTVLPAGVKLTSFDELPTVVAEFNQQQQPVCNSFEDYMKAHMSGRTLFSKNIPDAYQAMMKTEYSGYKKIKALAAYQELKEHNLQRTVVKLSPGTFVVYQIYHNKLLIQTCSKRSNGDKTAWTVRTK